MDSIIRLLSISGFAISIITCFVGFVALFKSKGDPRLKFIFFFMCLSIATWSFFYGLWLLADNHDEALFLVRSLGLGSILIPIFHLHWIFSFLGIEKKYKWLLWYGYISSVIFLLFAYSSLFVRDVELTYGFPFWPKPGPLYHIYLFINFIGLHIIGFYQLLVHLRRNQGIKHQQIKHVFIGLLLGVIFGSTNFPFWYDINIPPYGNPIVIIYISMYAYTMIRYRLFDIHLVVRRGTIRIILAAFIYGMFHLVTWAMVRAFGSVWVKPALITGIFIAIAFVLVLPLVEKGIIKLTNRYLYASIYNSQKTLRSLTRKLTRIVDVLKISSLITETVHEVLDIESVRIFAQNSTNHCYHLVHSVGFESKKNVSCDLEECFFTRWVRHFKKAVVKDELQFMAMEHRHRDKGAEKFIKIQKYMEKIGGEVCIPFVVKRELIGFLLLGAKISRDAYTKEDIELLETLGNQTAIALENALLYENMEQSVEDQTKEIKAKNVYLEKLLAMRGQFLDIASHQLRTPISVIKGYVSMLREGDYDSQTPAEKDEVYRSIAEKTEKLSHIVRDILYASELDTGEFTLKEQDIARFPIIPYVSKIVSMHQDEARVKNISLTFSAPGDALLVRASERYMEVVFDNLITNALHYTPRDGKIVVRVKPFQDVVRVEVEDTGVGIPKEDQPGLFEKFKRGANANSMYTDGSGLGLFITKELMDGHPNGKVGFTSELNKGTKFWVEMERAF
ncbi:MAG: hypothetical protein A3E05_04310 [Candidatus Jacksonbacteria bacterium RIFCSPHIGHO2_12_FULL_44_12]|nr:MAG: hypothetical protein A3E05_04310 [Candidatus Jacksonbacteria bacterium RIFCSPHIGHO2_12_FULL_44_12]